MGNIFRKSEEGGHQENRVFYTNQPNDQYGDNKIKSTTSSFLTFIPLNLMHQFKNLPNLYFLLICVMQSIPQISVTNGQPTTLLPLSCVILTVMIKDAYQQFCRFLKDNQQNNRNIQLLSSRGFVPKNWKDIQVGEIFKVKEDQLVPCDAIVLKSNLLQNKCFIQTKSLDGQTNLKARKAPTSKYSLNELSNNQLYHKRYKIEAEPPNEYLNNAKAFINIEGQDVPVSIDNIILRGCYLKNCAEAICVALYVGSQTKVILNSVKFSAKKSKMMTEIDKMVISIFLWQLIIALMVSIFNRLFQMSYSGIMEYIQHTKFWLSVPSWWLMMTYFVPISLIVTMQLIKLFQGGVASKDYQGYSRQYDCYVSLNNTSINENLGQIKYVFTDKTGTLTKNQMNFKKIIVDGQKYGERFDLSKSQLKSKYPETQFVSFGDSRFMKNLSSPKIQQMLRILYLCHDIYVQKKTSGKIQYNSSSPDEIALINFAKLCGKQLIGQSQGFIKIHDHHSNTTIKYQKLALLEFSSDRKRMSVIVKSPANQILILTKGADSAVQKLLKPGQQLLKRTNKHLEEYSIEGLRTLMLAFRVIPQRQWADWQKIYKNAQKSIRNREQQLDKAYNLIQKELILAGGTAVEDKLQDEVQSTITNMKAAGIKFFILTGDKKQTAINIGRSSGLVDSKARLVSYPQEYNQQMKNFKGQKIYLIDASGPIPQLPSDLFHHQTICYRCTPIQKANIVNYVKERSSDLTLAIGDGANDVNMITSADVGVGVKGKQGTEATRVADIAIGQFKFLELITLYYGREWYRKNARLACFNFFKNWYHVSAVITYGAYSYFSAQQIFDIYAYQLFNAFFTAFPIMVYAVFDEQYNFQQSKKYPDIYQPGLLNSQFNQKVYYQNITQGLAYGFISIVLVFMVLEDDVLTADGRMGYFKQSGAVLFFSIVLIVNFKILVMSNGISIGLLLSIVFSIGSYWVVYYVQIIFLNIQLKYSFYEEWTTPKILLIHLILIFLFTFIELGIVTYKSFEKRGNRMMVEQSRNYLVDKLLNINQFR